MDKGFCEVPVINYLKKRSMNAIIALPLKGKTVKSYLKGRKSKIISYTMKSQKTKATATFDLAIVCKYSKKKYNRRGAKYFAYALIGTIPKPRKVFEEYTRCHVKIPIMEKTKYINHIMQVKTNINILDYMILPHDKAGLCS